MKLVVGLGNPGRKYQATRHNIGFEVIRKLAEQHGAGSPRSKFEGRLQECLIGGERTLLLMPQTYMNLSGRSVRQAVDFFKLSTGDLLLVCDDFNLPLGTLRLRARGTDGGQKGLADVIQQMGADRFSRLRFGVGPVPDRWEAADFVLGRFDSNEQQLADQQVQRACDAVKIWISEGIDQAMNQFNGGQLPS